MLPNGSNRMIYLAYNVTLSSIADKQKVFISGLNEC